MTRATHSGWISLAGTEVGVHRLDDGRRVLRFADVVRVFGDSFKGRWSGDLIEFRFEASEETGIEAGALTDFCDAIIDSVIDKIRAGTYKVDKDAILAKRVLSDISRPPPRPVLH